MGIWTVVEDSSAVVVAMLLAMTVLVPRRVASDEDTCACACTYKHPPQMSNVRQRLKPASPHRLASMTACVTKAARRYPAQRAVEGWSGVSA